MPEPPQGAPPDYKLYRTRPRLLSRGPRDGGSALEELRHGDADGAPPRRRRITPRRVLAVLALALVGWLTLSLVLFLISAQLQQNRVSEQARAALTDGGVGVISAQTTLILGSDQRTEQTAEPGSSTSGPSRADSIMLLRFGGGHSAKLSIPRDTVVDIPGYGRSRINAAYALGGAPLMIQTVEQFLGIEVNHLFEVSFADFPRLIDAMGGIDYTGGCVVSRINGGTRNGGYTLRLRRGTTHIDGRQALALARTRKNDCNPREDDRTRARRQQKILSAMKSRVFSFGGFIRMPFIAWNAPKAMRSDMGGPRLLGYGLGMALAGNPPTAILRGTPEASGGLQVSDADRQREVRRFLDG